MVIFQFLSYKKYKSPAGKSCSWQYIHTKFPKFSFYHWEIKANAFVLGSHPQEYYPNWCFKKLFAVAILEELSLL